VETVYAVLVGAMVAGSIYLMLARNLIRFIFGLVLVSNAVNLLIFTVGRFSSRRPPLIADAATVPAEPIANALPQALVLTAIVIGFALLAFIFVLFYRAYQEIGTADTELMRVAEPHDHSKMTTSTENKGEQG
jgi:multicomponent Na+:H+ antiporter subunit C